MKKVYKSLLTLMIALAFSASSFAAPVIVKTMSLGDGISASGYVHLVVKLTDDATGPDIGITLHQTDPATPWNDAMAISMFDFIKNSNGGIHIAGYNAGTWDWETNVKAVEKNKAISIWIAIDVANDTHGLSAQMEGETEVTTVFSDYGDRESRNANSATTALFCSVFVNDKDGMQTSAIEVLKDAEIVSSIEAFDFSSLATGIASLETAANVSVFPAITNDYLTISSVDEVSSIRIFSLTGQEVLFGENSKEISVAELNAGTYIVKVETINNLVSTHKFIKR